MSLTRSNVGHDFNGYWNFQHAPFMFGTPTSNGAPQTAALMFGGGTETYPLATAVASACFMKLYCKSTDTGEDNRLVYLNYNCAGAAGGFEAIRAKAVGAAASITAIRGGSFNAGVDTTATSQVRGLGCGVEAQFEAGAATRVMTGTIACLNLSSYIGAGNTLPASHGFVRMVDDGSVKFANFLYGTVDTGAKSDTKLLSTGIGTSSGMAVNTALRCVLNGTTYWLLASTTAPSGTS